MIIDKLYTVGGAGNLEYVHHSKKDALRAKGKLLTYDQLSLPQKVEAKELEERMQKFMARIDEIQAKTKL